MHMYFHVLRSVLSQSLHTVPAVVVECPHHDHVLIEPEDPPTQLQLTAACLLSLGGQEDEGGVAYHHPQGRLESHTYLTGIVTLVVYDHLPRQQ